MKVAVDEDHCRGHGVCCGIAPDVFDLTDDGYSVALVAEVPVEHTQSVLRAAALCPEHAISTTD
ncbi:ferredoxin [Streptomyces sp. NPDC047829]|uniref:ferredoxin n=1 Tax=Streptomyces sp. NPDC047829 TaxID=3154609 RepID=UPI0033CC8EBA